MIVLGNALPAFATETAESAPVVSEIKETELEFDNSELPIVHEVLAEALTRGAKKPPSSASVVNLASENYSYEVTSIGYRVYTNSWFTGATAMTISVSDWELIEEYKANEKSKLTIAVYDQMDTIAAIETFTITWAHDGTGYGSISFSGLNAKEKYYVLFEVPTNKNIYSFNGTIKKS